MWWHKRGGRGGKELRGVLSLNRTRDDVVEAHDRLERVEVLGVASKSCRGVSKVRVRMAGACWAGAGLTEQGSVLCVVLREGETETEERPEAAWLTRDAGRTGRGERASDGGREDWPRRRADRVEDRGRGLGALSELGEEMKKEGGLEGDRAYKIFFSPCPTDGRRARAAAVYCKRPCKPYLQCMFVSR